MLNHALFRNGHLSYEQMSCCLSRKIHSIPQVFTGSFAVEFRDHLRSRIICGPFWGSFAVSGSFAVGDHLRYCTVHLYFTGPWQIVSKFLQVFVNICLQEPKKCYIPVNTKTDGNRCPVESPFARCFFSKISLSNHSRSYHPFGCNVFHGILLRTKSA